MGAQSHLLQLLAGTGGCEAGTVVHEKGVKLLRQWIASSPVYRCDFDGDRLDYDATMKLLKTFSQFR